LCESKAILDRIANSVERFEAEKTRELCEQALQAGISAYNIVMEGIAKGLRMVGEKFEAGEYFLTELIMAGEAAKESFEVLKPHFTLKGAKLKGKVVIGTVKGDLHNIGKDIVAEILRGSGFEVFDLGVDVPAEKFVEKTKDINANIIGISCLLSTTLPNIEQDVKAIEKAGLRDRVKIIIGGPPTTSEYARKIGVDASAKSAVDGLHICERWSESFRSS